MQNIISIHAPTRGATQCGGDTAHEYIYFNPRSHKGSDYNCRHSFGSGDGVFQSTLPQGERHLTFKIKPAISCISIHAPTRGATEWLGEQFISDAISIHAPTRGATSFGFCTRPIHPISIHAPTRGATHHALLWFINIQFQSTLPQGERQQFYTKFHICFISFLPILSPYHISTHSPLPTFNHFLYIFSGANRPGISCLLPFRTKTISGIL